MAKNSKGADRSQLNEWLQVLGRARQVVPKLQAERAYHAAEIAKLDAVLGKLSAVVPGRGQLRAAPARTTKSIAAKATATPARDDGSPSLANTIVAVLTDAGKPLSVRELFDGIRARHAGARDKAVQKALRALRSKGAVKTAGKTKAFRYSVGSAKAAPAPTAKKTTAKKTTAKKTTAKKTVAAPKKRGPKPKASGGGRQRKDGAPTVREIALKALAKRPLGISQLVDAVVAVRKDVKRKSAETIIAKLRHDGVLKTTGKKGSFQYSAAR